MGGCASTHHQHQHQQQHQPPVKQHNRSQQLLLLLSPSKKSNPPPPAPRRPEIVRVIREDGGVEEFNPPVTARNAMGGKGGGAYLCSWESMYVDAWAPEVGEEEELKAGQVYFAMPKSKANQAMSLPQMCALAIKASSALSLQDFHSSFRR